MPTIQIEQIINNEAYINNAIARMQHTGNGERE